MLNKIRKLKEKKGFTLVELIVVIAIIAILTAVIVPLVGRYSAQATYTTLQDAAKTVSNNTNTVISDVTMMGSVMSNLNVTGSKSGNSLTIHVLDASDNNVDADHGDFITKLTNSLQDAVPNGATFRVEISTNTVAGVAYTTTAGVDLTTAATPVSGFTEAYQIGSAPVGVAGNRITTT
ncbi:MAG: prepilin-type N-terminal cleavage/methylation domain-containing protein [Ruminococcaceae bacterium]|nr:prepilin-type N-terminal cleavage/methylation domain-containing protein [Oscillospiraceae bacterium]